MPSSLHLFDPERHALAWPESFEALEALSESLYARVEGKNVRFVEFALIRRSLWCRVEGPRHAAAAGQCLPARGLAARPAGGRRAARLPGGDRDAAALGLVAFDAALGLGFLPDGRVMPAEELEALAALRAVLARTPALAAWPDAAAWRAALRPIPASPLAQAVDLRGRAVIAKRLPRPCSRA